MRPRTRLLGLLLLLLVVAAGCARRQGFLVRSSETREIPGGAVVVLEGLTHPIGMDRDRVESSFASIEEHRSLTVVLVVEMPGPAPPRRLGGPGGSGYVGQVWHERHAWRIGGEERRLAATLGRDGMLAVAGQAHHLSDGAVFLVRMPGPDAVSVRQLDETLDVASLADPIKTLAARHAAAAPTIDPGSEQGDDLFRHAHCERMSVTTARSLARVAERVARLPDNPLADRDGYARTLDSEQRRWMCALRELTRRELLGPGVPEGGVLELLGPPTHSGEGVLRWSFDSPRMVNPYLDVSIESGVVGRLETGIN